MRITKYVHATIGLQMGSKQLLFDPGKYNLGEDRFGLEGLTMDNFLNVDVLFLSHTHADHYWVPIVKKIYEECKPVIIANKDVGEDLNQHNIDHLVLDPNQKIYIGGLTVRALSCEHIVPCIGFFVTDGKESAYFVADSRYIRPEVQAVDALFVPIGNRGLVMDPKEAANFTAEVGPKIVIPIHYESPKDTVEPEEFTAALRQLGFGGKIKVMAYKETIHIN